MAKPTAVERAMEYAKANVQRRRGELEAKAAGFLVANGGRPGPRDVSRFLGDFQNEFLALVEEEMRKLAVVNFQAGRRAEDDIAGSVSDFGKHIFDEFPPPVGNFLSLRGRGISGAALREQQSFQAAYDAAVRNLLAGVPRMVAQELAEYLKDPNNTRLAQSERRFRDLPLGVFLIWSWRIFVTLGSVVAMLQGGRWLMQLVR